MNNNSEPKKRATGTTPEYTQTKLIAQIEAEAVKTDRRGRENERR